MRVRMSTTFVIFIVRIFWGELNIVSRMWLECRIINVAEEWPQSAMTMNSSGNFKRKYIIYSQWQLRFLRLTRLAFWILRCGLVCSCPKKQMQHKYTTWDANCEQTTFICPKTFDYTKKSAETRSFALFLLKQQRTLIIWPGYSHHIAEAVRTTGAATTAVDMPLKNPSDSAVVRHSFEDIIHDWACSEFVMETFTHNFQQCAESTSAAWPVMRCKIVFSVRRQAVTKKKGNFRCSREWLSHVSSVHNLNWNISIISILFFDLCVTQWFAHVQNNHTNLISVAATDLTKGLLFTACLRLMCALASAE